jgi:hypothetical protein
MSIVQLFKQRKTSKKLRNNAVNMDIGEYIIHGDIGEYITHGDIGEYITLRGIGL